MPDAILNIPTNSRFHSSLNEIDLAMGAVLLNQMLIADTRDKTGEPGSEMNEDYSDALWDTTRVFQVDELTTEEMFNTFLLRKRINGIKNVDVSYPMLGYLQEDLDSVFWGTGNRLRQWELSIPVESGALEVGDEVCLKTYDKFHGMSGEIAEIITGDDGTVTYSINVNGSLLYEYTTVAGKAMTKSVKYVSEENLTKIGEDAPYTYKAKAVTGTYKVLILVDNRDEAQYLRDKFILRCADGQIWHKYASPTILDSENQLFTVFGIPNLDRFPSAKDKLSGEGYIYGVSFDVNFWGCLTETPLPAGLIETIRMNMHVENDNKNPRIVIS